MIHFQNVYKRYPGSQDALSDVSFHLAPGQMTFLTGHSGAGKSTLLKLVSLIERPSRGNVLLNNINLGSVRNWRVPYVRRHIGIIFQAEHGVMVRQIADKLSFNRVKNITMQAEQLRSLTQDLFLGRVQDTVCQRHGEEHLVEHHA